MKKLVLAAATVMMATISLAGTASADGRYGDEDQWRRDRQHSDNYDRDNGNQDRDRDHDRDRRRDDDDWRRDRDRDHDRDRWRHDHWRHDRWRDGYWDGPRVIVRPYWERYCFIKKVRRFDNWGNMYIKRIRVCR